MTAPQFLDARLPARFWEKVIPEPNTGCWLWIANVDEKGYGRIQVDRRAQRAHRISYAALVGPIDKPQIDHKCRTPGCVNPAHLRTATNRENSLAGISFAAVNARKAACPKGHPYDPKLSRRGRRCEPCRREQQRRADDRHAPKRRERNARRAA